MKSREEEAANALIWGWKFTQTRHVNAEGQTTGRHRERKQDPGKPPVRYTIEIGRWLVGGQG
jgi:hypothetical protein